MKKILSSLLAFAMVLALFSGVVIFNASAEIESNDVWMSIPFVNQYTDAELAKMVVSGNNSIHNDYLSEARNASNVSLSKDEKGRVVFNATTGSELYYGRSYFVWSTSARANPIKKVGLINGINIFGDAELSNKKGIAIKFGGNDTFFAQLKKVNLTINSSKQIAIVKLENGVKQGDYYVYDFAGATYDSGNSNTVFNIADTYDGILDSLCFTMQFGTVSSEIQFWIEDFCVIGDTDSRLLYNDIANGKANGLDVTAAEAVYKDPTATQEQINAARGLMSGAIMHLPLINQYTLAQAAKMGVKNGWQSTAKNLSNVTYSKDAQGKLVISATTPAEGDQWGLYGYISTGQNATFYNTIKRIDSIDIFGDAEISNKSKLAIKVNGDAAFQSAFSKISQVTFGTSQSLPSDDSYHGVVVYVKSPTKLNGYWVFDLSSLTVNGYDRSGIDTIDKAYDGIIDSITMNFAFKTASPSVDVKFWIEDAFLIGAADTTELHGAIRDAKAANVDADLIAAAETVYKDTATTQAQVDAQTAILRNAINANAFDKDFIFTQLPGIQNWTQGTVDAYNEQSAAAGSDSGTKAELVNHHTTGQATQALKLELGTNTPNAWSAVFSTSGNVADRTAASQLGDIFGDYKTINKMNEFDGLRIAIQNAYGDEPSFAMSPAKTQIIQLMLVGSGSKAWSNGSYPYATHKQYYVNTDNEALANTAIYHDGYYYFYFKDFISGWSSSTKFFEKYGTYNWVYDNIKLIVQTSNFNSSSSYNGGALYLSDMQLFRTAPADKTALGEAIATLTGIDAVTYAAELAAAQAVYDDYVALQSEVNAQTAIINDCIKAAIIGDLWEYNYTAESWAPLAQAAAALDLDAAAAAKANLVPVKTGRVTGNLMEGWTTANVNATVTANSGKLCDSIGEGLNINNAWNAGDFSNNTTFEADNNLSLTATADFTGKAMGWKNMDRSKTLQNVTNGAYPALNVAGLKDAEGIRFKLESNKPIERILIGLSTCAEPSPFATGGHREMYAMKIKPENVGADGYINIPWSYFEAAFWSTKFAQDELDLCIVFIVEAYGAENGTKITISDLHGYITREFDDSALPAWQYNYTADSWAAYSAAIRVAKTADERDAALALLKAYPVKAVTENFFKGWTTDDVNAVVTANPGQVKDSIGNGLNTNGVWNAGDFSDNTTLAANNNFSMTATADFAGKSMGWKNLDRSATLNPDKNPSNAGADYPFMAANVNGLSKAEGVRFKLEVTGGTVERILIGLSNCNTMVREQYAIGLKADYVDADGYINVPFSCFEKAWWCDAFAQSELEDVIVFIIEAYGVTSGTTITVSDFRGYKELVAPTPADVAALNTAITKLINYDFDSRYVDLIADAQAVADTSEDQDEVLEMTDAVLAVTDKFDAVDRTALKANIDAVKAIDATLWATEIAAGVEAYYDLDATAADIAAAAKVLQRIIDKPETPVIEATAKDDTSITVTAITGAKYKLNDGEWQDSNAFTGLLPNKAYSISAYVAENDDHIASDVSVAIEVTTEKGSFGAATVTLSGTERYTEVLTATVADVPEYLGTYSIEWRNEAGDTVGTGETYTIVADDIGSFVYAVLVSDNAGDTVASDPTGIIGKGIIKNPVIPTASAIQYPQTIGDSVLSGGDTGIVTGTWSWVTPDVQPLSSQSGSAYDVVFTPDANFIDLYEVIEARVVVTVNPAPYEPVTLEDEDTNTDLTVTGEFMQNVEMHVTDVAFSDPAYLALLRASGKDNSGLPKLVLFKSFSFTVNGEEIDDIYDGDLTVTSFVGTKRAGQTVSAWFFIDGKAVNYEGIVDDNGILTVTGVKL